MTLAEPALFKISHHVKTKLLMIKNTEIFSIILNNLCFNGALLFFRDIAPKATFPPVARFERKKGFRRRLALVYFQAQGRSWQRKVLKQRSASVFRGQNFFSLRGLLLTTIDIETVENEESIFFRLNLSLYLNRWL